MEHAANRGIGLDIAVTLKTSPEGAGDLLSEKKAETVTVKSNPNTPTKIDLVLDGKTYTFVTAEIGTAIMKASLIHG